MYSLGFDVICCQDHKCMLFDCTLFAKAKECLLTLFDSNDHGLCLVLRESCENDWYEFSLESWHVVEYKVYIHSFNVHFLLGLWRRSNNLISFTSYSPSLVLSES